MGLQDGREQREAANLKRALDSELCVICSDLNSFSGFTSSVLQVRSNSLLDRWKLMVEYHLHVRILLMRSACCIGLWC